MITCTPSRLATLRDFCRTLERWLDHYEDLADVEAIACTRGSLAQLCGECPAAMHDDAPRCDNCDDPNRLQPASLQEEPPQPAAQARGQRQLL